MQVVKEGVLALAETLRTRPFSMSYSKGLHDDELVVSENVFRAIVKSNHAPLEFARVVLTDPHEAVECPCCGGRFPRGWACMECARGPACCECPPAARGRPMVMEEFLDSVRALQALSPMQGGEEHA